MQVKIKTKRGTVELSFRKLRIFHRLNGLEDRMQAAEEQIKKIRAVAEACPYRHRAAEPVDRAAEPVDRAAELSTEYNAGERFVCWTEGETDANKMRDERLQAARKRGGSGA